MDELIDPGYLILNGVADQFAERKALTLQQPTVSTSTDEPLQNQSVELLWEFFAVGVRTVRGRVFSSRFLQAAR